jgi:hypothetical protein
MPLRVLLLADVPALVVVNLDVDTWCFVWGHGKRNIAWPLKRHYTIANNYRLDWLP